MFIFGFVVYFRVNAICQFFRDGHKYSVMLQLLFTHHGIHMSLRSLKRKLVQLGLKRNGESPLADIVHCVNQELRGPGTEVHLLVDDVM